MTVKSFCCDDETGEMVTFDINEETGEPTIESNNLAFKKKSRTQQAKHIEFPKIPQNLCTTKRFESLKEEILSGSNKISPRLLLLPTLAIFPAYMCTLLIILETFLHVRCHIINRKLQDSAVYYQSPFHMITRTFCGLCRDCDTASKIGQLQDQRRVRYDYLRSIAM